MRVWVPLVCLVSLLVPATLSAQTTGSISGSVIRGSGGTPIDGALVQVLDASGNLVTAVTTNASGIYSTDVAPGANYNLLVSADGFGPYLYAYIRCAAADCPRGRGLPVSVSSGITTTINIVLTEEGRITGRVTQAANGAAASSASVALYNAAGSFVATASVASDGTYSFGNLPDATYFARTSSITLSNPSPWIDEMYGGLSCSRAPGTTPCRVTLGTPIVVLAGGTTSGIDFSLDPAGRISGTVTGLGEAVQSGTAVYAYSDGVVVAGSVTDSSGLYEITGLPTGTYTVRTDVQNAYAASSFQNPPSNLADKWYGNAFCLWCGPAAGVPVTAGQTTANIDLVLFSGSRVTGTLTLGPTTVLGPHTPPAIEVYYADGTLVKTIPVPAATPGVPVPWEAAGLYFGQHYIRSASQTRVLRQGEGIRPTGGWWIDTLHERIECVAADCLPMRGTPIVVNPGSTTTGININSEGGATISGSYPGSFPSDASLTIYDSRGVALPNRVATDLNGHYMAGGLPGGVYFLKLNRDPLGRFASVLYRDNPCEGCAVTFGTPIVVTKGENKTGIDFAPLAGRSITGTVRSTSGTPLSTIGIDVFEHSGERIASVLSAADGVYTVTALNPGTYYARTSNQRGFADERYQGQECSGCNPLLGMPIVVALNADTTGIDFSLAPATLVSGTVTTPLQSAPAGTPVPSAVGSVAIRFTNTTGALAARAVTDGFGKFETTLQPGDYQLETEPLAGYLRATRSLTVGGSPLSGVDLSLQSCGTRRIAPIALANAAVGTVYRQTLTVSGGTAPIVYAIVSGALPPGLTLDPATGVIAGTPATSGSYTFTVGIRDGASCGSTRTYTVIVEGCTFTAQFSATSRAAGEPFLLPVSTTCGTWTVTANVPWITISNYSLGPNGFVLLVTQPHTGSQPRIGTVSVGPRVLTVFQNGVAPQPPFGVLETPDHGASVSGSIAVSGWALDDLAVIRVEIYRDPVAGEGPGQVFIGNATRVPGARPDVEAAYPSLPGVRLAGYGYLLLTNVLPNGGNGVFNLHAYAVDADLVRTLLGSRTIVAANSAATAPFGAIDTPAQGETISGAAYVNFGWALTPLPKTIPFNGAAISVYIDGVGVGFLNAYNLARSDVSTLFPGLNNSAGPVGYRIIDTTALSDGLHTIAWVAGDDVPVFTGIGSRYFTVQNSAWVPSDPPLLKAAPPAFTTAEIALADRTTAVPPRIDGVDLGRKPASLASIPVDETGARNVELAALQLLELALPPADPACASPYEGYLVARDELRPLPIGSSLDAAGTFYWQPGPAFHGTYQLLFVRTSCDGTRQRLPVTVRIR